MYKRRIRSVFGDPTFILSAFWVREFKQDYPEASCLLLYGGAQRLHFGDIRAIPIREALHGLEEILVPELTAGTASARTG